MAQLGSSAEVGSSNSIIFGFTASAGDSHAAAGRLKAPTDSARPVRVADTFQQRQRLFAVLPLDSFCVRE
jgi:hypothetical protein